ncbi:MAG: ATP-binding protein [Cuniculiplasma sp.]|jgi:predicted ATP-dependent endonuclease of OLD family
MKITNINIENFKAIDSLQFNPRMLNIFVGRNNTGKTSILQAIEFAFDEEKFSYVFFTQPSAALKYGENIAKLSLKLTEDKRTVVELDVERGTLNEIIPQLEKTVIKIFERALNSVLERSIKSPKIEERKRRVMEIGKELIESINAGIILELVDKDQLTQTAKESVTLKIKDQKKVFLGLPIRSLATELTVKIAEKLNLIKFLGWENLKVASKMHFFRLDDSIDEYLFPTIGRNKDRNAGDNSSSPLFIVDPTDEIKRVILDRNRLEVIAQEIEQIIKEDNIVPGLTRFNFKNMVFEGVEDDVSMDSMGDGFKALIGILASLYQQPKNTIVLLEEPEVHMHPGYMRELAKYLVTLSRTRNIQLFISTHSMDLIQCFLDVDSMSSPNSEFVKSELFMLRLSHLKNVVVSEEIDYNEADSAIKDLEWDLRGI